jgi:hypothetical protein
MICWLVMILGCGGGETGMNFGPPVRKQPFRSASLTNSLQALPIFSTINGKSLVDYEGENASSYWWTKSQMLVDCMPNCRTKIYTRQKYRKLENSQTYRPCISPYEKMRIKYDITLEKSADEGFPSPMILQIPTKHSGSYRKIT